MCGITGIYSLNNDPIDPYDITRQTETIIHRGPNEGGQFLSPRQNCGLGIRRLSIIDVAGGQQPLSNEDNSIHLVYNGETYNHKLLRAELEALGHRPKTHSDAEAILHGYEAWGAKGILQRIRGMGAFALWDETEQQLLLARDRFGIKPLYYAHFQNRLYFASEIKAILSDPQVPRRINLAALQAMFTVGFVPGPATMFEGIYKLPAAHLLIARDGNLHLENYWTLDYEENQKISEGEAVEQFLDLLKEAIDIRLMSEVPLGALLSGGLDSSTLVALMQAGLNQLSTNGQRISENTDQWFKKNRTLHTISIGFDQAEYNESRKAQTLAKVVGTTHHPITFTLKDFEIYPQIVSHLEEPQCYATTIPIYLLYQACQQAGLTVILTG
ncbi:MAG: asparagine synthase (glutamine-hydrolyzing), partial [Chloroflexota bacterium]